MATARMVWVVSMGDADEDDGRSTVEFVADTEQRALEFVEYRIQHRTFGRPDNWRHFEVGATGIGREWRRTVLEEEDGVRRWTRDHSYVELRAHVVNDAEELEWARSAPRRTKEKPPRGEAPKRVKPEAVAVAAAAAVAVAPAKRARRT